MADVADIGREAREWLVRMDGDKPLSDTGKEALKEWMSRSVSHRLELIRIARFWRDADILTELAAGIESERRKRRRPRRWTILMTAACASICSLLLAYCSLGQLTSTDTRTYVTRIGEQRVIFLPDGSSIKLNTNSEARVSYSRRARTVRLARGEALFNVTPDPERPFEVYAANSVARAVGTAFAVRLEGRRVDVTVERGVVDVVEIGSGTPITGQTSAEVSASDSPHTLLRAGEIANLDTGSGRVEVHRVAEFELRLRMAWEEGCLAFSGEPLSEVVAELNRYSTTQLVVGDPKLAALTIGGRFKIGDQQAVLNLLRTTFGIAALQGNDGTIRLQSEARL